MQFARCRHSPMSRRERICSTAVPAPSLFYPSSYCFPTTLPPTSERHTSFAFSPTPLTRPSSISGVSDDRRRRRRILPRWCDKFHARKNVCLAAWFILFYRRKIVFFFCALGPCKTAMQRIEDGGVFWEKGNKIPTLPTAQHFPSNKSTTLIDFEPAGRKRWKTLNTVRACVRVDLSFPFYQCVCVSGVLLLLYAGASSGQ